jgi:release factor glutamine methyltransferase
MSNWFLPEDSIAACQQKSPLDALETRMLLSHVGGLSRVQLITQSERQLTAAQIAELNNLVQRRVDGEPLAYLIGEREFYGLNFTVSPAVLIPRPDTELLVELALQHSPQNASLLDLGTGSGAIAVSIAAQRQDIQVCACDISTDALTIAKINADRHLVNRSAISFYESDWYQQIPPQQFHTIVSNPPYIVKDDEHLSQGDLRFEPINALTDHADGLSAYRKIITDAPDYLARGGWLLMEHGYHQSQEVQALLRERGFDQIQSWQDLAGIWRVTGGIWMNDGNK